MKVSIKEVQGCQSNPDLVMYVIEGMEGFGKFFCNKQYGHFYYYNEEHCFSTYRKHNYDEDGNLISIEDTVVAVSDTMKDSFPDAGVF